ncbi:phospholipase D-like domain-containing protein [Sulfurospirillum sp. 1612]|uniref:phospholipase D-like domain-containing protein n=1 Tax=Sulfurospirillum sp. 1612 TaxID=3094835 RepID=UPI002F93B053
MNFDLTHIILYHSLIVLGEFIIMFTFVHMIYKRRSPVSMIAWFLFMILLPYVAVVLYFIFGFRKRKSQYLKRPISLKEQTYQQHHINPICDILKSYSIADVSMHEHFRLSSDAQKSYEWLIEQIHQAQTSIYFSTYVLKYDYVTKRIFDALIQKANAGVSIKILADTLGSWQLYFSPYRRKKLQRAGIEIRFFMPIFQMPFRNYINLRNHRKIYLFDNHKVISGGINLASEYIGYDANVSRWEDMLFMVEGQSVARYFEIFTSDWYYATKEQLVFQPPDTKGKGHTALQVVPSGPDMEHDVLYEALLSAIYSATTRIWIVTPYFVPDASILQALIIAQHKGIDVKLITPKQSNHVLADLARNSYIHELEESGIEVALHHGVMLHAKAILFDDDSVMLGSVNLDNRSLFLNYEIATFIYSKDIIEEIKTWMRTLLSDSSRDTKEISSIMKILENAMRIVAPQL